MLGGAAAAAAAAGNAPLFYLTSIKPELDPGDASRGCSISLRQILRARADAAPLLESVQFSFE